MKRAFAATTVLFVMLLIVFAIIGIWTGSDKAGQTATLFGTLAVCSGIAWGGIATWDSL